MKTLLFSVCLLAAVPALSQHSGHMDPEKVHLHAHAGQSPYAEMQARAIKALSERQVDDLRDGKGMSFALAAEPNGYPGPLHVIAMAELLGLSRDQFLQTERLYREMQGEAKAVGKQLISSEAALDRLFRERKASLADIQEATARAAQIHGQLRVTHLKYHLAMAEILTPSQVAKYNHHRGYR